MSWSRRELIRAGGIGLATALAGCTRTGRFNTYRISRDPTPPGLEAEFSADAVQGPHEDGPALLRLGIHCTADSPRTYTAARGLPMAVGTATRIAESGRPTGDHLVLVPVETPTARLEGCWTLEETVEAGAPDGAYPTRRRFSPGERVEATRRLVNGRANAACYPPGEYRFSDRYRVETADGVRAGTWGFSLTIRSMV